MPDKKIGDNSFIFKVSLDLYQLLQKNKVLFVSLVSENKQIILNDAFKEIGTCRKVIEIKSIAIKAEASGAFLVDINMGCPVKKSARKCGGSALLKEPELAQLIVKKVQKQYQFQ